MNTLERLAAENRRLETAVRVARDELDAARNLIDTLETDVEAMAELRKLREVAEKRYLALRRSVDASISPPMTGAQVLRAILDAGAFDSDGPRIVWRLARLDSPGVGDD